MLRKTPPLEAIEIFVAAAQGGSFRSVARRLALSPSAISRRIAALEDFLGICLFDRGRQSQTLNAAGRKYLALVEPAIGAIQKASGALVRGDRRLIVATSHSFAASWLTPRLAQLDLRHGIDIEVVPTRDFDALRSGEAQLGIWGGLGVPPDMAAEVIAEARAFPVCAAALAYGRAAPTSDAELAEHPLLAVRSPARMWDRWFAMSGIERPHLDVREFATQQLMYEAAASGRGIALALPLLAEPYLRSGKLRPCVPIARALGESYSLYRPLRRQPAGELETRFARWLRDMVARSLADFERIIEDFDADIGGTPCPASSAAPPSLQLL